MDRLEALAAAARLVHDVTAAAALTAEHGSRTLPGLSDDPLLSTESPLVGAAREQISRARPWVSFLWPKGGPHAPDGHVRVTVLTAPDEAHSALVAVLVLSRARDLRGLTPRELEVLGLLVEGCSNRDIARRLVVAPRTAAAHIEHVLPKLEAATRTAAAVTAAQTGLYVPDPDAFRRRARVAF